MSGTRTRRRRGYASDHAEHNSPEEIAHAEHAAQIRRELAEHFGIVPEKCLPTGDGLGFVRLTFAQIEELMYEPEES